MESLSKKLTTYILKRGVISQKNYEIYLYGFQIFLELILNMLCSIIIALLLDMKIECFLFFLFFIPLRSYNGGIHMKRYLSCLIMSCTTLTFILLTVKYFSVRPFFSYLLYVMSILTIIVMGPINHPNRAVNSDEDIRFKTKNIITLILNFAISIIFFVSGKYEYLFLEALIYALVSLTLLIGHVKYKNSQKPNQDI